MKKLCEYKKVQIVEGAVCADHVHMCVKIPPKESVSEFMGYFMCVESKAALDYFKGNHDAAFNIYYNVDEL